MYLFSYLLYWRYYRLVVQACCKSVVNCQYPSTQLNFLWLLTRDDLYLDRLWWNSKEFNACCKMLSCRETYVKVLDCKTSYRMRRYANISKYSVTCFACIFELLLINSCFLTSWNGSTFIFINHYCLLS